MPASVAWVAFRCRFTTLTSSRVTRPVLGWTRSTRARFPASSPEITCTMSPLVTWSLTRGLGWWRSRRRFLKTSGFISDHLRRKRHDLHVLLVAQLARDWAENAGGPGFPGVVDEHRGIFIEPDVGPVLAAGFLGRPHDHRPGHVPLLDLAGGNGVLDRDNDHVAQAGVAALGAAEDTDHQRPPGPGVVRDSEHRLLLHHDGVSPLSRLLGPLQDLGNPPAYRLGQGPSFHNADRIPGPRPDLVSRLDQLAPGDLLPVHRVGKPPLQQDTDRLGHLVAGYGTHPGFSLPAHIWHLF